MSQTIVNIDVEVGSDFSGTPASFDLSDDISTAQQVIDELRDSSGDSKTRAIRDWCLLDFEDSTIYVSVTKDGQTTRASW